MQIAKKADYSPFDASSWKIAIVVADFNRHITAKLLESAQKRAAEYKITDENIEVIHVAGAVEIPLVLQALARSGKYDALLAIGCVIRGATPHFDYVCQFATEGVMRVQLDNDQPIGFGVLTCNNEAEAQERANLGGEHLDAVMRQAKEINKLAN